MMYEKEHFTAASKLLRKALIYEPDDPSIVGGLGAILAHIGDIDEAKVMTIKALELEPNNTDWHNNLDEITKGGA